MNPVDHVRCLSHLELSGNSLTNLPLSPMVEEIINISEKLQQYHGTLHRVKKQVSLPLVELVCCVVLKRPKISCQIRMLRGNMAWLSFLFYDSYFDNHTAPGRGGVKILFEPIDLTLTIEISHQRIDSFMRKINPSLIPLQFQLIFTAPLNGRSLPILSKK